MKEIEKILSFPFPIMRYDVQVEYAEVERASGVSYILMQLINNASGETETLSDVLTSFDIAADLHDIFAVELHNMVKNNILTMKNGTWDPDYILSFPADNFEFTDYGQSMFKRGMYLTGNTKSKKVVLFYNPMEKTFSKDNSAAKPITDNLRDYALPIWEEYYEDADQVQLEDWVSKNQKSIGIKNGNQVVGSTVVQKQIMLLNDRGNMVATIGLDGVHLRMRNPEEQVDFDTYEKETARNLIGIVNGVFLDVNNNVLLGEKRSIESLDNLTNAFLPLEAEQLTQKPSCVVAFNNRYVLGPINKKNEIICDEDETADLILADIPNTTMMYLGKLSGKSYSLADIDFDGITMTLLVEEKIEDSKFNEIIGHMYDVYSGYPAMKDAVKMLKYLDEADTQNRAFLINYANSKLALCEKENDKVNLLLELDRAFKGSDAWQDYLIDTIVMLFSDALSHYSVSEIKYIDAVFSDACKNIGMSKKDYYKYYTTSYASVPKSALIESLFVIGCKPESILSEINVIPEYAQNILDNRGDSWTNPLFKAFDDCRESFNGLRELLRIDEESTEYGEAITYNTDLFFSLYARFDRQYKAIEEYSYLAQNEFKNIEKYVPAFNQNYEEAWTRKMAEENPTLLDKKAIDDLINKGELNKVIGILYYRVQSTLAKVLASEETKLNNLINDAWKQQLISTEDESVLHRFRQCRNGLVHPEAPKIPYERKDVEEWEALILSLE